MPALVFCAARRADTAFVWHRPARMRGRPIKPHTSARRALPLACTNRPLRLLFDVVNILLHDSCRF